MSLTKFLRVSPIRFAALGPSAESLMVKYRFPGTKIHIRNTKRPVSSDIIVNVATPSVFYYYPDSVQPTLSAEFLTTNDFIAVGSRTKRVRVESNVATAGLATTTTQQLYLEV